MRIALFLPLAVLLHGCASAAPRIVVRHVGVVDVEAGATHPDQSVVIRGGRIERVDAAEKVRVRRGERVIDGTGKYLVPGLWDMHVHADTGDLAALLDHGVTGARDMGGDLDSLRAWRRRISAGTLRGPRLVFAGPQLAGAPATDSRSRRVIATPGDAVRAVDSLLAAGADFIKVWEGIPRGALFAAAREARARRIPFVGHVPDSATPGEVSDSGQASIEHLELVPPACLVLFDPRAIAAGTPPPPGCGPEAMDSLLRRLAANGTALDPTLGSFRLWAPAAFREGILEGFRRLVPLIRSNGLMVLAGSDLGTRGIEPGASLHDELDLLVQAGFAPAEALRAATLNPARFLHREDSFGAIRRGAAADLLMLDGDPLADIRNTRRISLTLFDGREVPPPPRGR
jgi:imidazolonepropionase-like amidohydrolase